MTNKDYAKSLRAVADFYESAPEDFPQPEGALNKSYFWEGQRGQKELVRKIALGLGNCEKYYTGDIFIITKDFYGLSLAFTFNRGAVCEKRVIGFKECEGYTVPPYKQEIVEWDCKSILTLEEADAIREAADTTAPAEPNLNSHDRDEGGTDIPF